MEDLKPRLKPGFTGMPHRTLEGLSAWPLSPASLRIYLYLCRQSRGWLSEATKDAYCRKCIAPATHMHASTVSKALTELEQAELVEFLSDGRILPDLDAPAKYRATDPRCPEHTSRKYQRPGQVTKRPRRRGKTATRTWRNGHAKLSHPDTATELTLGEKQGLETARDIRTTPASPGVSQLSKALDKNQSKSKSQNQCQYNRNGEIGKAQLREVAESWTRKFPYEGERSGSVSTWAGKVIQYAERLGISPIQLIQCVRHDAKSPRGYLSDLANGKYPLPPWTEDPQHRQTFWDWINGPRKLLNRSGMSSIGEVLREATTFDNCLTNDCEGQTTN